MRRVTVVVELQQMEDACDALMPLLPGGVFETELPDDRRTLTFDPGDREEELRAAAGPHVIEWTAEDTDEDLRMIGLKRSRTFANRVVVRSPQAAPPPEGLIDVVVDRIVGSFGTGDHPTTRASLELLMDIEPSGSFADLGCGTGVLSIVASKLGFAPVYGCDHEPESVKASLANAERNAVGLNLELRDLLTEPIPLARTVAANVPFRVHEKLAAVLPGPVEHLILSGIEPHEELLAREIYGETGLRLVRELKIVGWPSLHYCKP
jgi:ribosomal protein L11 methyltransferase